MLDLKEFGRNLKNIRKDKRITVATLSGKADISESTIRYYERGEKNPSLANAIVIAKVLNCGLDELIGGEANKNEKKEYVAGVLQKYGLHSTYMDISKLNNVELVRFEEDIVYFAKMLKDKYKL